MLTIIPKKLPILLVASILLANCQKNELTTSTETAGTSPRAAIAVANAKSVPNEVLVKFKNDVTDVKQAELLAKIGGKVKEKVFTSAMEDQGETGVYVLSIPVAAVQAITKALGFPEVEYAEPNYIYQALETANDPAFVNGATWGSYGLTTAPFNEFGSQAAVAWQAGKTGSSDVYIGIIDQGYMYSHEDLIDNSGVNPFEIAGNGIDDDKNGYVDDVNGWDFLNNDNSVFDGTEDSHGTHVAGIIGAKGGNGIGLAGVSWNVKLLSGKFIGPSGGNSIAAAKAIDYFTALKKKGLNIVATNNSWGSNYSSKTLKSAIDRANRAGILFIAASGNTGWNIDVSAIYPASYNSSNIISVGALTETGALADFSNYGVKSVDIAAPGQNIYSTYPVSYNGSIVSGYAYLSGTSMAAPFVSGAAALYASAYPNAKLTTIKNAILSSAIPTPALSGKMLTGARLDLSKF